MRRRPLSMLTGCALGMLLVQFGALDASAATSQPSSEQIPVSVGSGAPATAPQPSPPAAAPPDVSLSNELALTTWAHPAEITPIYAKPEAHARRVTSTHLETEDGFLEVYLLLTSHTDAKGQVWVELRIPGRPNGRTGWVRREALGSFHVTHWLVVVSRAKRRLTAYYNGHRRFVAPVGIGKPSSPTPPGHFWIRERFRLTDRSNPYWPYALGTSDYSTLTDWPGGGVVGIHGDFGEPQLIPGDPSHGCIRMRDADIAWLAPRLTIGTPVRIV
jgi:L,D-transpeptidase catalytic domain